MAEAVRPNQMEMRQSLHGRKHRPPTAEISIASGVPGEKLAERQAKSGNETSFTKIIGRFTKIEEIMKTGVAAAMFGTTVDRSDNFESTQRST